MNVQNSKEQVYSAESKTPTIPPTAVQPQKSNKKKIILISTVAAAAVICIIAVIAAAAGKSNSLWIKPFDEDSFIYGYKMTPEEFIKKANELSIDNVHHEFEYGDTGSIEDSEPSAERYYYDIRSEELSLLGNPAYYSECGIDYYEDKTIRQTILFYDYKDVFSFDWAYHDLCVSAVQILYAYGAFDADSASDVLNTFKLYSDQLEKISENQRISFYFKYGEFVLYLFEDENSDSLYFKIQKTNEQGIEKLEDSLGASLADLLADTTFKNNDETVTESTAAKKETTTKETKKSPENCFVSTKALFEKVKPFFADYGYDIDSWDVTTDNNNLFIAETSTEIVSLQNSSLTINLNKGGNKQRGLFVLNSGDHIQLWFDGDEKNIAYELLDVIFDGAYVNDKKLSEYIESEYENHLNGGNVSNWENGRIRYSVQFKNDITYIMITHK